MVANVGFHESCNTAKWLVLIDPATQQPKVFLRDCS